MKHFNYCKRRVYWLNKVIYVIKVDVSSHAPYISKHSFISVKSSSQRATKQFDTSDLH